MNFELTSEQRALKELARKAAKEHLAPIIEQDEEEGRFRPEVIRKLGELGLTGIPVPEKFDGAGLGYLEYAIAMEEISTVSSAYAESLAVSGLPQIILNIFGNEEQKKKFIPPLARGEHVGAFSLTESGSGSDASALRMRAEKKGKEYILNGTKLYTTQGNAATTMIAFARTGGDGPKGISAFIIDKTQEKIKKSLRVGKIEKKMGMNISPTCELVFEDMQIPEENLVSAEGQGFRIAMTALDSGRITIGAIAVGLARAALEYAVQFSQERKQFGRPIGHFQGIQFMLADMYTKLEASRLLVYRAAALKDSGKPFTQEASAAKLFSTDSCMEITTDAVQILGGAGYMKDFPLERYMREAKSLQIVEGTNQIQRMVIGRNLTGAEK